jgi:phosphate transport system substrate-binding protein
MKSLIAVVAALSVVAVALVVTGCSPQSSASTKVVVRGSNTVGEELAPQLAAAFAKQRPEVGFDLEFKGTSYGIGSILMGNCDIATASRALLTNEPALARERGVELQEHLIGSYAVAVIVHPDNPVGALTLEQLKGIFTGQVKNWKAVGGADQEIVLCIRDQISGTHLGFQELAMAKQPYATGAKAFTNYAAIAAEVAATPGAIGYTGIDLAGNRAVKGVSLEGVAPTVELVNAGKYPLARSLRLFTDKRKANPAALEFVTFAASKEGQEIVARLGMAPLAAKP